MIINSVSIELKAHIELVKSMPLKSTLTKSQKINLFDSLSVIINYSELGEKVEDIETYRTLKLNLLQDIL